MQTNLFDYELPPERIATHSVSPRSASRLMVVKREAGSVEHAHFFDIGKFLKQGDLLVVNETKVFKARLHGMASANFRKMLSTIEIFLLRPEGNCWSVLARPGKKIRVGTTVTFTPDVSCIVKEKHDDGTVIVDFGMTSEEVFAFADAHGEIPQPPYVHEKVEKDADYQTTYAKNIGSVAAPTAGFHFTTELIEDLKKQGITFAYVTLHVGMGTFRPIKSDTLEEHEMHEEWLHIPEETQHAIAETKKNGGRVIAVGTTTTRALESGIADGATNIFITPGYKFKTIDGLITNFHLPKSTLLVLVSAFLGEKHTEDTDWGRKKMLEAYETAKKENYRFYSFGDAMFIS